MSEALPLSPDALLEALLFAAPQPPTLTQLAVAVGLSEEDTTAALELLEARLAAGGLRLQRLGKRLQLITAPQAAPLVEQFLGLEINLRLSQAALETLAIVAYRQPITRPGIDGIRGVNSDGVMRSLLSKGLVEELGRTEGPGRPILYGVTADFLQYFGLSSLDELPPFEEQEEESELENNGLLKD